MRGFQRLPLAHLDQPLHAIVGGAYADFTGDPGHLGLQYLALDALVLDDQHVEILRTATALLLARTQFGIDRFAQDAPMPAGRFPRAQPAMLYPQLGGTNADSQGFRSFARRTRLIIHGNSINPVNYLFFQI